ncbi:MAG: cytochrome c [Alphaproteobacteria bacterium]|nr:cytochrome c [Alphaproteobacteria bacterium]
MMSDAKFWRAGAIATTLVMLALLAVPTVDTLGAIRIGGRNVPPYGIINQKIAYVHDAQLDRYRPEVGGEELLFGRRFTEDEARKLAETAKLVIQSRACMLCHTFFGNGSYYAPALTKSWLDQAWSDIWMPMTEAATREEAMAKFLMTPDSFPAWTRRMPNLHLSRAEAEAVGAYLKWISPIDTNGFPSHFVAIKVIE